MAEKINICRSITFYSNYIPASIDDPKWQYTSIGTIDGIQVSKNLVEGCDAVTKCIWREQKKIQQSLQGRFTAQQIFVVRYSEEEAEQRFWEDEKEYPFYFFCFCQFAGDKKVLWSKREKLERYLKEKNGLKAITYLTYDNTDLFIVLRANEYNSGVAAINELHQKNNCLRECVGKVYLKNSYTVFAMERQWVCNLKKEDKAELNKHKIENILISIMEKQGGNLEEAIGTILKTPVKAQRVVPILGESDNIVILEEVGWGDFLELYKKMVLERKNFYTSQKVASISTLLIPKLDGSKSVMNKVGILKTDSQEDEADGKGIEGKEGQRKKDYLTKIRDLKDQYMIGQGGRYGELEVILNALPKFIGEVFNDYIFYSLLKPIEVLLELTDECGRDSNYNKEYYYEFINYLYIYIQTSNMSDKHTVQGLGFNSKIYDVPIKISAFYNAFLHKMTEALNVNNTCEYVFLTVPGMQFNVNVNELYPNVSNQRRLILIKIPEQSFYRIHDMMNILGHETAHYVGREYRNRRDRLFCFARSYVHIFVKYLSYMSRARFSEDCLQGNILKDIEKRIVDLLIMELEERRLYFKNKSKDVSIDYFAVLIPNIAYVMEKMFEDNFELALAPIGGALEDKEQAIRMIENFREIVERFMYGSSGHSALVDSRSVLKILYSLYEECFADIMSVLVLGTSMEDYINCIVSESEEQGTKSEQFKKTDAMFRIGTVILCLYDAGEDMSGWKKEFDSDGSEPWREIARNAIRTCYSEESVYDRECEFEKNVYAFVASKTIFDELYSYLKKCVKEFTKEYNGEKNSVVRKKIQDIKKTYDIFAKKTPQNAEDQIAEISKVIEEYREYFWKNIKSKNGVKR